MKCTKKPKNVRYILFGDIEMQHKLKRIPDTYMYCNDQKYQLYEPNINIDQKMNYMVKNKYITDKISILELINKYYSSKLEGVSLKLQTSKAILVDDEYIDKILMLLNIINNNTLMNINKIKHDLETSRFLFDNLNLLPIGKCKIRFDIILYLENDGKLNFKIDITHVIRRNSLAKLSNHVSGMCDFVININTDKHKCDMDVFQKPLILTKRCTDNKSKQRMVDVYVNMITKKKYMPPSKFPVKLIGRYTGTSNILNDNLCKIKIEQIELNKLIQHNLKYKRRLTRIRNKDITYNIEKDKSSKCFKDKTFNVKLSLMPNRIIVRSLSQIF